MFVRTLVRTLPTSSRLERFAGAPPTIYLAPHAYHDAGFDTERLEFSELAVAVDERLRTDPILRHDPTVRQIWSLLVTGHDRADIGALLGLRRQRVHERFVRLRAVVSEFEPSYAVGS